MTTFREQFSIHVATAFARQLSLADFLGEHNWSVDIKAGTVDFGNKRVFPVQLLGTESEIEDTWLWAWANEQSNLPPQLLQACSRIREFGRQHDLAELTDAAFPRSVANGHMLAMLSAGLIGNCCYYRGPYDGGALFFLVNGLPQSVLAPIETVRATTVISEVICQFDIDHRLMAEGLLTSQGFTIAKSNHNMTGTRSNGDRLNIEFDAQERIAKYDTVVKPGKSSNA
jgi:hypothetical protein